MDDLEFVQRCVSGDKQSWDEFVDKYSLLIYNYIHSASRAKGILFSQDVINDIFQEILLSLMEDNFKKLGSFKGKNGCSLASWLRLVAVTTTIDYMRTSKTAVSIEEENDDGLSIKDALPDVSEPALDAVTHKERLSGLTDCIEKLQTQDKYFLEFYINKGLSLEELRRLLNVSRGTVDMRRSRIVDKLKDCFKDKGFMLDY